VLKTGVGFVPGDINILFNGKNNDRKFEDKWEILANNLYDPKTDLVKGAHGMYSIAANKSKLSDELKELFFAVNGGDSPQWERD